MWLFKKKEYSSDEELLKKYKQTGEMATQQTPLVDIIDIDTVDVTFFVKATVRKTVAEGQVIKVKIEELDGAEFEGKVNFVDPRNDAASGLVRVKVKIENKDYRIKAGMKGLAEFGK